MACTYQNALKAAAYTGHRRFLELLDPDHSDYDPRYFSVVDTIASGPPPTPKPFRHTPSWLDAVNTCLYRECRTGCQQSLCHAGYGDEWGQVTLAKCKACLFPNLKPAILSRNKA